MKRKSIFAKQGWYPDNKDSLIKLIENNLKDVQQKAALENIKGIIAPHAGYVYSLKTALYAYQYLCEKNIQTVFLLTPSHNSSNSKSMLSDFYEFETPLGPIEQSLDFKDQLIQNHDDCFCIDNNAHEMEHSLEMQLPLIKYFLKSSKILPFVIPSFDYETLIKTGEIIQAVMNEDDLIIMSSDLSHFPTHDNAVQIDQEAMESWKSFNTNKVYECEMKWRESSITECAMCGLSAIVSGMKALKKNDDLKIKLTHHSTSYDVSFDKNRVVGYGSAVIYK